MNGEFAVIRYPELVFGIAGPLGIDLETISTVLNEALHAVEYKCVQIRLTQEIADVPSSVSKPTRKDYYSQLKYKMDHASQLCRDNNDAAWAMRYVVSAIRRERAKLSGLHLVPEGDDEIDAPFADIAKEEQVRHKVAYIIRQIKRPEEVRLLRNIYGKQFVLISAYGEEQERLRIIQEKIKQTTTQPPNRLQYHRVLNDW